MGQRELLFVVIAALAMGSCAADYESNGKNLSWIYDIKNSATTQNQTYRLDTDTGAFRYHFDISAVDSYKFETNSNDAVTMGCYGWKDLTNKWHGTNYVADSHGRRDVRDVNKPVIVYPSENEQATRLFLDHLPQCLAFALDTPPLMVYVFTNHAPTKPPPVVFVEPHDHVPHSSEVVHKVHEGVVPPYLGGGSPTVPLVKKTTAAARGSVKVPQAGSSVTGGGLVKVPLSGGSLPRVPQVTGGSPPKLPLSGIDVTLGGSPKGPLTGSDVTLGGSPKAPLTGIDVTLGGSPNGPLTGSDVSLGGSPNGPLTGIDVTLRGSPKGPLTGSDLTGAGPLTATPGPSSRPPTTAEPTLDLIADVTSVVPILSTYRTVKGRQDLHGLSTQRPVIASGSGEDLTDTKTPIGIDFSLISTGSGTNLGPTSVPSGTPISIQPSSPSLGATGGDSAKETSYGTRLVASPTVAGDVQISQGTLGGGINSGSGIGIGTPLVSVSTVGVSQGTPTGASPLEKDTGYVGTGRPLVSIAAGPPTLGKSSPVTTAAPTNSGDSMDIFNPSKWALATALKNMVSAVFTAGQKILGISKDTTAATATETPSIKGSQPSPTPSKQAVLGPVTTLYKVDIPTLSKTGLTSIGSKLVDLPSTGPLSQGGAQPLNDPTGAANVGTPSGRPTAEVPSGFKITVEESNPGPDSILNIGVSPPTPEFLANFVSSKTTASPTPQRGPSAQNVLIQSPAPASDYGTPSASSPQPTGRPFEGTTSRPVSELHVDVSEFVATSPAPAISAIPSARLPIGVTSFTAPQRIGLTGDVTPTSPQFVQTVSTGFSQGPTISTIGEFITSRPIGLSSPQAGIGLLPPSTTPSTFVNRYDTSAQSDRPAEYGPSSVGSSAGLTRTVTAAYLPPPTAEGPTCSCVCPRG